MTEQEFRELTAYQPPSQPKHNPPVSSIAAAVATGKGTNGSVPPVPSVPPIPQMPEAGGTPPPQAQHAAPAETPPSPPLFPVPPNAAGHPPQNQFISQIHQQPKTAPAHEAHPIPPVPAAPMHVPAPAHEQAPAHMPVPDPAHTHAAAPAPVSAPVPVPAPEPHKAAGDLVPHEKHNELMEQYTRLVERYKHLVEERDALSRQVAELKQQHSLAEHGEAGAAERDYKEEIRLLGKLIEDEQSLRKAVVDSGAYKPGDDPYARHDKLVNVFLNIVART